MSRVKKQMKNNKDCMTVLIVFLSYLASISYDEISRNEFHNNVSAEAKLHDINPNQLKLKLTIIMEKMRRKQQF